MSLLTLSKITKQNANKKNNPDLFSRVPTLRYTQKELKRYPLKQQHKTKGLDSAE